MPTAKRRTGDHPAVASPDSPRLQALLAEVATRLRPVCGHLSEATFDAVVRRAAEATYRWETRTGQLGT